MNRRVRNRTHGGVGGGRRKASSYPILDGNFRGRLVRLELHPPPRSPARRSFLGAGAIAFDFPRPWRRGREIGRSLSRGIGWNAGPVSGVAEPFPARIASAGQRPVRHSPEIGSSRELATQRLGIKTDRRLRSGNDAVVIARAGVTPPVSAEGDGGSRGQNAARSL
jgi:hypothetical protein